MFSPNTSGSQHSKDEAPLNYVKEFLAIKKQISKIQKFLIKTECEKSQFCEETGLELYLKKDFRQVTGSCHARSALCTLLNLSFEHKRNGVVTALEEDALPLCYFGDKLEIPVTIVLPDTTSLSKIYAMEQYEYTTVLIQGNTLDEAESMAFRLATMNNMYYIKRDSKARFIGYGTIGIEIIQQVPNLDVVVVPYDEQIYTSILTVMAFLKPSVKVIIAADRSINSTSLKIFQSIQVSPPILPTPDSVSNEGVSISPISLVYTSSFLSESIPLCSSVETISSTLELTPPFTSTELSSLTKPKSSSALAKVSSFSTKPSTSALVEKSSPITPKSKSTELLFRTSKPMKSSKLAKTSSSSTESPPFSTSDQLLLSSTNPISVDKILSSSNRTSYGPKPFLKDSTFSSSSLSQSQKGEPLVNKNVTVVTLTDEEIDISILKLFKKERCIVDKFGAMSLAACLKTHDPSFEAYKNKRVVSLLTSCNDDIIVLSKSLERALFEERRLENVSAEVPQDELHPTTGFFNTLNNVSIYQLAASCIMAICCIISICLLVLYENGNL